MMKSFFKKLAFVMALAMVVSAMAPAATAKAAEAGLLRQESTTWDTIKTDELTEGDEQDYKFAYAPTNWKSLGLKWTSSDEAVATVDEVTGLVKAVKAGTTTIKVAGGTYEASLVLTVKAKEVAKTFEVEQKTANKAVLTFTDATAATTDITVVKVLSTPAGDKFQPFILNADKTKVEGNTVSIEPWVAFGNATYLVTANGVTQKLETAVGDPAVAKLEYKEPYTFAEAGKAAAPTLTVTDAKGVAVTNYTATYELVKAEPAGYAYVNASTGDLYFYVDGAKADVKVVIRYGNNQSFETVLKDIKAAPKPVVTMNNYLETVAVVPTNSLYATADKTAAQMRDAIDWNATKVKINDGTAQIVGLIKKSDGSSFSINDWSVGTKNENKVNVNTVNGVVLTGDNAPYKFTFESVDSSKVIVDETTGTLVGVNTTEVGKPAYVLVKMQTKKATGTGYNDAVIVAVATVDVQAAKAPLYTTLGNDNSAALLTKGDHTKKEVTPTTYNQYEEKVTDDYIVSATTTFNNKTFTAPFKAGTNKTVVIDASKVNEYFNSDDTQPKSNYFVFNITMKSGKTTQFFLTLKEVTDANLAGMEYKLDVAGATIKADALDKAYSVGVKSLVLGENYGKKSFFYGKPDATATGLEKGALYVIVRDPSGDVITPATSGALIASATKAALVVNADKTLTTVETGVYTVELYRVIDIIVDTVNKKTIIVDTPVDTATFTVENQLPNKATDIKIDPTKKVTVANGAISFADATAISFKINGTAMNAKDNASVITVDGVSVANSQNVFVYSLKVKYYIGTTGYVVIDVPVNQIFSK